MSIAQNQIRDSYTSIIAVSEEAPSTFSLGDIYYNTTTNFLYTAIKDDEDNLIWGDGESPIANHLYCDISTNVFYGVSSGVLFANIGTGEVTNPLSNDLDANNHKILNLANGTSAKDAINKSQLDAKADIADVVLKTEKGVANGVAVLDSNSVVPLSNLPLATTQDVGLVKPDGTTLTVDSSGTLYAAQQNFYTPPLLFCTWFDHIVNQVSWLRADTFSWQSGDVYTAVYNHLVNDLTTINVRKLYCWMRPLKEVYTTKENPSIGDSVYQINDGVVEFASTIDSISGNTIYPSGMQSYSRYSTGDIDNQNVPIAPQTETIGDYIITYYQANDGHKIVLADQETNVSAIYTETGVAWYYVLDTANTRFKLPRTKFGFTGLRDSVGKYVPESLPNITGTFVADTYTATTSGSFNLISTETYGTSSLSGGAARKYAFNASNSSSTYQNNASVQQRATQMYLYFYVGNYIEPAISQTAGINSELFADKLDLDASNLNNNGKSLIAGLGMPSSVYDDLTLGASGATYTAPANGWFYLNKSGNAGEYNIITNNSNGLQTGGIQVAGQHRVPPMPALKGDIISISYTSTLAVNMFRFIYAEGSKSEAN